MTGERILLLDRSGYAAYRGPDGQPYLDPRRYNVTLATLPEKAGQDLPGELVRTEVTNMLDAQAVLQLVDRLPAPDRVVTTGERFLLPAAQLRQHLGLPGDTPAQARLLRDKVAMKEYFGGHGLRVPHSIRITAAAEAADLLRDFGKIVLKPVAEMGSTGVMFVDNPAALVAAAPVVAAAVAAGRSYEAEEFITGQVHHVDSIVHRGQPVVTSVSQYLDANTVFPLGGHRRSTEVPPGPVREQLLDFNRQLLATIDWFSGVSHHEIFWDAQTGPVLCEIAGRPGGGGVVAAFRHRYGRDLVQAALTAQLDRLSLALPPPRAELTGWTVVYPPQPGVIASLGTDVLPPGVISVQLTKKPGDRVNVPTSFGQGIAIGTMSAPDADQLASGLNDLAAAISVSFE
jgi:biotin carboxylase